MTTQIVLVGNTLTVEVPEEMVEQSSLPIGGPVEWVHDSGGGIRLVRSSDNPEAPKLRLTMDELLEGLEEGTSIPEYDWGGRCGVEVW